MPSGRSRRKWKKYKKGSKGGNAGIAICRTTFPFALNKSDEFDGIVFLDEYQLRVARSEWLKKKFGRKHIPEELFKMIVDADIRTVVLDRWYAYANRYFEQWCIEHEHKSRGREYRNKRHKQGIGYIWEVCSKIFDGKDIDREYIRSSLLQAMKQSDDDDGNGNAEIDTSVDTRKDVQNS